MPPTIDLKRDQPDPSEAEAQHARMEPRIPASPGGGGGGGGGETKDTSAQRKAKAATQSESNNKTITHATKRKITFAKPQKKQDNDTPTPPPPIDDLKELLSTPKRMAPALSLILLTWLVYGRLPAVAGAAWAVFFVSLAMAFETDEEDPGWTTSMTTHAWAIGNAGGVILGAAALQRHDYDVLLALSLLLFFIVLVTPLTESSTSSLALLVAGFSVGITFLAGFLAGPHAALSLIAILVPAWVCGVIGGVAAAVTPAHRLYTTAATIAALAVLAGAWGASHDPPLDPD